MLIMPVSTSDGLLWFCFFNDTATTEIYTLSLHDALPISIYEFLSFDFGPTLLDWMDGGAPSEIGRAHVCSSHITISYAVFCLKKKTNRFASSHASGSMSIPVATGPRTTRAQPPPDDRSSR